MSDRKGFFFCFFFLFVSKAGSRAKPRPFVRRQSANTLTLLLPLQHNHAPTPPTHRSFVDNWEWKEGFNTDFGIVDVDFKNATLPRTPKDSARWLRTYIFPFAPA